jgi:hypothetical protein
VPEVSAYMALMPVAGTKTAVPLVCIGILAKKDQASPDKDNTKAVKRDKRRGGVKIFKEKESGRRSVFDEDIALV